MKFTIVASKKDIAGMNIINKLKNLSPELQIHILEDETVFSENFDKDLKTDFIIFASKHASEKKVKTLTVHPIGNWKKADLGGRDNTICKTSALILKHFFQILNKNASQLDYQISLEATHHGPYVKTPSLFIEIGSTKQQWQDLQAVEAIAKTVAEAIATFKKQKYKIAVGIGGPHYCPNFNKIQLENKFAISHIIAEYALPLTDQIINQAIEKTTEPVTHFLIDWKALGNSKSRQQTIEVLKKFDLEIVRTREAKE